MTAKVKDAKGHGIPCQRCGGTLRYAGGAGHCVACIQTPDKLEVDAARHREKRAAENAAEGKTMRASNSPKIVVARRGIIGAAILELAKPSVGVRQMYYWMVTHHPDIIAKDDNGYRMVQRDIKWMRENDPDFDWDLIEDGQRTVIEYAIYRDAVAAVNSAIRTFQLDYWRDHDSTVQVWIDKDGLAGTLETITWDKYRVPLFGFRGMSSMSFIDKAAQRIVKDGRDCKVLVFGDLDPTGYIAVRNIEERLTERARVHSGFDLPPSIDVQHVALNDHEQVRRLGIASAFRGTKAEKDDDDNYKNKHVPAFFEHFGSGAESCEIDALHPDDLRRLVDVSIAKALTGERSERKALAAADKLLEDKQAAEQDQINRLRKMVRHR
jgi:hypothetical protein